MIYLSYWRKEWQPALVFLPGEFHGQRSLAGYTPWGYKESDTTEQLMFFTFQSIYKVNHRAGGYSANRCDDNCEGCLQRAK